MRDQVPGGRDDLHQVVRGHVGGHADGDAGRAVHEQVRERRREDLRLGLPVVVVGAQVDHALVDAVGDSHGRRREPALGVSVGSRWVVVAEAAEVAVAVHQGEPQRPRLGHPDQGVVDRGVAVRVQGRHHVADDAGALHVTAIRPQPHLGHPVEDPPVHRLEAVPGVRQGPGVDDRVGVLEVRALHLVGDVDVDDVLGEVVVGRDGGSGPACHAARAPTVLGMG